MLAERHTTGPTALLYAIRGAVEMVTSGGYDVAYC